jgi:hypothetical protein
MKYFKIISFLFLLILSQKIISQTVDNFNLEEYLEFLEKNKSITAQELQLQYPAGVYQEKITASQSQPLYLNLIDNHFNLTDYEKVLLEKHGFMVTERLSSPSFGYAFLDIYHKDLPVFVSTDAILHALHISYDRILMDLEYSYLIPKLKILLEQLHGELQKYIQKYPANSPMYISLIDLDVYLTIARRLLDDSTQPLLKESVKTVDELLLLIEEEQPAKYPLFAETKRIVDFSQFTPRGHYTQSEDLTKYFKSMMWLGRTEFYLIPPVSDNLDQTDNPDNQRQAVDAILLTEMSFDSGAIQEYEEMDHLIRFMVGESDNVTIPHMQSLMEELQIENAEDLLDDQLFETFQNTLKEKSYAFQRINSQILMSDPMNPEQLRPASAFMLLGQRFIIDSYVTGNVVYDKIIHNGEKVLRMLPSTLDVLFALGNDAAAQLLKEELEKYYYAPNLSALRYLIDSYENEYWETSLFNAWLNCIRSLNPPDKKDEFPEFMHTAAWWQEKMNTQLSSWAQLRHDNLLYAKQSYSGSVICSFPYSYVEPIPQFYQAVKVFARRAQEEFNQLNFSYLLKYFESMEHISDTLHTIATKELAGEPLSYTEIKFLQKMLYNQTSGCAVEYRGWYAQLFYSGEEGLMKDDLVVADIHTAPTDAFGGWIGWVYHVGTGPINLGVVIVEQTEGERIAYIGPVLSYYEHISTNFKRLTDEEWRDLYSIEPSFRPGWVNIYLANEAGEAKGEIISLHSDMGSGGTGEPPVYSLPEQWVLSQNYPNPFNASTIIKFSIPPELSNKPVKLIVYNVQGQLVESLIDQPLPAGNYLTRWYGTEQNGESAASGVYFYHLKVANQQAIGKMILAR